MEQKHGAPMTVVENVDTNFNSTFQATYIPVTNCPIGKGNTREEAVDDLIHKFREQYDTKNKPTIESNP